MTKMTIRTVSIQERVTFAI